MSVRKNEPAAGDATEHVDPPEADTPDEATPDGEPTADDAGTAGKPDADAADDADVEETDASDAGTAGKPDADAADDADVEETDASDAGEDSDDSADVREFGDADTSEDVADSGDPEDTEEGGDTDEAADAGGDETPAESQPAAADAKRRSRGAHARRVTPRQRLRALVAPRANKTQAVIALACLVLGFGLSVQVQSTSSASSFSSLRQSELVSLLDRLTNRQDHLRREVSRLQQEKAALSSENGDAARKAAEDRQDTLGILAGTEPATGPGIELTITDPHAAINAADLLNAVEELRDSGAEVMQIGSVRIGADTYFLDTRGGVVVDGHTLTPPYRVLAIGEPHTMGTAMNIPGGVLESLHRSGAEGTVTESQSLSITAVREP